LGAGVMRVEFGEVVDLDVVGDGWGESLGG
jgi:hypothetical protein